VRRPRVIVVGSTGASVSPSSIPGTFAPTLALSALPSTMQVDPLDGSRVQLVPCTSSFPNGVNFLTSPPLGATLTNSGLSVTSSGGVLTVATTAATGDFNTAGHGAPFLSRVSGPLRRNTRRLTMHATGAFGLNTYVGMGFWYTDGGNSKTCRIQLGQDGAGQNKLYSEYNVVNVTTNLTAGNVSTGVWYETEFSSDGTFSTQYQIGAVASSRPLTGWAPIQTGARFTYDFGGGTTWPYALFGLFGLRLGAVNLGITVDFYDDSLMNSYGYVRSARDGIGFGFPATSPSAIIVPATHYDSAVCTDAVINAWAAYVGAQRAGEDGYCQFLSEASSTGVFGGGSWANAGAIVTAGTGNQIQIQARLVSTGLQAASFDADYIPQLRCA
jgi:hypothetical protein